jgi:hypothetical protein
MNILIAFQRTITATGTPQNLPNNPISNSITIHAPSANAASIVLGNSSTVSASTGFVLEKGLSVVLSLPGGNANALWAVGTAGDSFSVVGA